VKNAIIASLLAVAALAALPAASGGGDTLDRRMQLAKDLGQRFVMKQQVGYTMVLFVVRQEGNRYPAIWAGKQEGGEFAIQTEYEPLDDVLTISSTGGFTLGVGAVPDRNGLADVIPCQALIEKGKAAPLKVHFNDFTEWTLVVPEEGGKKKKSSSTDRGAHRTRSTYTATIQSGELKVPFPGQTMEIAHSLGDGRLTLQTTIRFRGEPLGLPASQHGELTMEIRTVGPPAAIEMPGR
jgi:hypothetical protein